MYSHVYISIWVPLQDLQNMCLSQVQKEIDGMDQTEWLEKNWIKINL
jgi:hypothetical protein